MRTIVFPTDFSDEAARALPIAAQLAQQLNATLHLVHVLTPVLPGYMPRVQDSDEQYRQMLGQIELLFDELEALPCLQTISVKSHVLKGGDPVDLLGDTRFAHPDLMVVPSTGATGLKEKLLGSNAEHLIQRATVPVLVLKNPPAYLSVKTIVFASDFQDFPDSSIEFLQTLVDKFDSPVVHLLFVNTLSHFVPTHEIKPRMEAFANGCGLGYCTLNQQDEFDVEKGLLVFAQDKKADLIVLGTHGRHGLRHLLEGSVAASVVNHTPIPVLTLPLHSEHAPTVILDAVNPGLL